MKIVLTGMAALGLLIAGQSCTTNQPRYVDLNTETPFELVKDPQTGLMVDAQTGKPLNIYVDLATKDTIDGRTGTVINGKVQKIDDSYFVYADNGAARHTLAVGRTAPVQTIAAK